MPSFQYIAISAKGDRVVGTVAAASEQAVLAELETRSLTPVLLTEQEPKAASPMWRRRVASTRQLAGSYGQLADLLRAGVPLLRAIRLLGNQKSTPGLAKVWSGVAEAVERGGDLADAMAAANADLASRGGDGGVFPSIQIAMVRAGEKGGFLEQVLERMSRYLSAQAEMRSRVIGSLIYPTILVVAGIGVLGVIFWVMIPMFRPVFSKMEAGGGLPPLTRMVLRLSDLVRGYGPLILIALAAAAMVVWRLSKRPDVRARMARWRLRMPVVGPLTRAMATARFCRILGTMLANSIPMLAAMQIAREAAGNPLLEKAIEDATEAVRQGQPLAPPLAASGLFAEDVVEMISVGESANNLDTVLVTIAETVEGRVDRMLAAAVKLIEPLMLVVLAGVVLVVAMALILPMTKMGQYVR